ncbi:Gfo/Idh/MocA family oxidoreductase [Fervidibacter sacchari]|uniref:Dehydrogenase n=1 Tax=Candidatus Fervidibacter sacchari TaxID=1448929 RepID=A0ABT2EQE1_9BACT|nr:Gfo/Idh/MocA family oxidoreductase [Candidatus Fervidibacter sacchari]MCS3920070.1 putative dehydrogenase [Candidatus Fervidibacter sacchari]WKU16699.1 Gfo/Idh/MocA family oxidoreductase [Candidatus Fervidibacter sacchari]
MEGGKLKRRDFVKVTTGAALAFPTILVARQRKTFRLALIGCGGRGRGAVRDAHEAAKILGVEVKMVAFGDWFRERALRAGKEYGVAPNRCFGGPTAYREVLETEAEIVLIATAPAFHPVFVEAAVKAGKHLFVEKPVAVDPVGCRRVIAAGKEAEQKGLVAIAGTEMRHDFNFRLTHQAVAVEGALGRLYGGRIAFCIGHMFATKPINPKTPDDLIRTWQNWVCLSGDHIVEQHIHNIDVANWFVGRPPVSAVGFGFRARRPAGDQYDFFSVDFDYGDGIHIHSMCRQIDGCWNWVGHEFVYEKGRTNGADYPKPKNSPIPPDLPRAPSSHVQEQVDLLYHVLKGKPVNQLQALAESTATAIMGRISAYTGQMVTWDEIMVDPNKNPALYNLQLKPTPEDFERGTVEIPQENVVPVPGVPAK